MQIIETLKNMNPEERKIYIKKYFEQLKKTMTQVKNDKRKLEALGKKLCETGRDEEILILLVISMIPEDLQDDVLELHPLLEGLLMGIVMKRGLSIAKLFGLKLPFR